MHTERHQRPRSQLFICTALAFGIGATGLAASPGPGGEQPQDGHDPPEPVTEDPTEKLLQAVQEVLDDHG